MSVMSIMKGFEDKEDLEDHQKNSDLSFSDNDMILFSIFPPTPFHLTILMEKHQKVKTEPNLAKYSWFNQYVSYCSAN